MPWRSERIRLNRDSLYTRYGFHLVNGENPTDIWGIVPIWAILIMAVGIPSLVYSCSFLFIRSFWDVNNAVCSTHSLVFCAVLTNSVVYGYDSGPLDELRLQPNHEVLYGRATSLFHEHLQASQTRSIAMVRVSRSSFLVLVIWRSG